MAGEETWAIEYSRLGWAHSVRIGRLTRAQAEDVWAMVCESLDRSGGTGWVMDGGRVIDAYGSLKGEAA